MMTGIERQHSQYTLYSKFLTMQGDSQTLQIPVECVVKTNYHSDVNTFITRLPSIDCLSHKQG